MTVSDAAVWFVVVAAGLGTFLLRASFLFLFGWIEEVPARLERALRFVPAAVMAALAAPAFLQVGGDPLAVAGLSVDALVRAVTSDRFLAGVVAVAVAVRTESITATILAGLVALVALQQAPALL